MPLAYRMITPVSRMEKHTNMTTNSQKVQKLRISNLDTQKPTEFNLVPSQKERKTIAAFLGLQELRKLRFSGQIFATGKADWSLTGQLGATAVQDCVVTLEPVSSRIDTAVKRQFIADFTPVEQDEEETEISGDENSEVLGSHIDLQAVMLEALSLALPLYPKAEGANLDQANFAQDGVTPMSDDDARPFAGLSDLRDKLAQDK